MNTIELSQKLNEEFNAVKAELLAAGKSAKFPAVWAQVAPKHNLNGLVVKWVNGRIYILSEEAQAEKDAAIKAENEARFARERFAIRVKNGSVEHSIRKFIAAEFPQFTVEHSRSCFASESFYIVDGSSKIVKLSMHNTVFQAEEHHTPFINLSNFTGTPEVKSALKQMLEGIIENAD